MFTGKKIDCPVVCFAHSAVWVNTDHNFRVGNESHIARLAALVRDQGKPLTDASYIGETAVHGLFALPDDVDLGFLELKGEGKAVKSKRHARRGR